MGKIRRWLSGILIPDQLGDKGHPVEEVHSKIAYFEPQGEIPDDVAGTLFYYDERNLFVYFDDDENRIEIGEMVATKVRSVEEETIEKGQAVYVTGASGDNPEVELSVADEFGKIQSTGLALEDIDQIGRVINFGRVRGVDTSEWSEGDELWISATEPGELVNEPPDGYKVRVGTVMRSHQNEGVIFVDVDKYVDEDELASDPHDNTSHEPDFLEETDYDPEEDVSERGSFNTSHITWSDELTDEEIGMIQLQSGEKLVVDRIEFRHKGGGSTTDATLEVYDDTDEMQIGVAELGETVVDAGESGTANLILIRLSNETGDTIDASVNVNYRIVEE